MIELCGGFGLDVGAVVSRALSGRCAVGAVAFGIASITRAAALATAYVEKRQN